jgi:uncharacterized repeat protein (TIGR02543 family)
MKKNQTRNRNVLLKKHGNDGIVPVEPYRLPANAGARTRRIKKTVRTALAGTALLLGIALNTGAQSSLTARNDTLRTGPLQTVRKDIIRNDVIPGDTYSWQLLDQAGAYGTLTRDGDVLLFTPNASCRNTAFDIRYELSGGGTSDTARVHIIVTQYNNPVNVIYPDLECVTPMPSDINFSPELKYIGKSVSKDYDNTDRLDGFSMPLVGDLNGDGKPEIVAMGISNRSGLDATGDKIIILNGQTGQEIYRYKLSNLGGTYVLRSEPRHNSVSKLAIADLDRNGTGDIIVTETGTNGRVSCLEPVYNSTGDITGMTKKWTGWTGDISTIASYKAPLTNSESVYGAPVPYISDLNGDGTPEVIVYNKIYNGVTGQLVCTLQELHNFSFSNFQGTSSARITERNKIINDYAYVGRRPGASWRDDHIPCMVIADINGDGIQDIVAGSKVYLMKDDNGQPALHSIIHGPSEITAQRGTNSGSTTTYVSDGFTAVADIDLDGHPDVIVLTPAQNGLGNDTENLLYVWDPNSSTPDIAKAATYLYTESYSGTMSYPFVGDINGKNDSYDGAKRLPEICFNGGRFYTSNSRASQTAFHPLADADLSSATAQAGFNRPDNSSIRGHIVGFTFHANPDGSTPLHQRLKLAWAMEHGDESSCTGITMFDFDNDNIKELCYRDERSVRVISPARKVYIPNTETENPAGAIRFKYSGKIGSYTGFEAPVIADVNMDGSADIVTLVHDRPGGNESRGFVHVFEHAAGTDKWAPCPPVWNQAIYFPLQINEDLTVPAKPQSMLTAYKDGNGETSYPYNGQWIQQPIIKAGEKYAPQVRYPDAIIADMKVTVSGSSSATIALRIVNNGSASVTANAPVRFYDCGTGGVSPASGTLIESRNIGVDIFAGESANLTYTFSGMDFTNRLIYACIMVDNTGSLIAGWNDCDPASNMMAGIDCPTTSYKVVAAGDTALCGYNSSIMLNAEPNHTVPQNIVPTYQWWHGYRLLPGETARTLTVSAEGEYRCYVTEDVCRGFTATRRVSYLIPEAHDDHVQTLQNLPVRIDILSNDKYPGCKPVPVILNGPEHGLHHGTAVVVNDTILYTPTDPNFTGKDSIHYDIGSMATVHIRIAKFPDNVSNTDCAVPVSSMVWAIDPEPEKLGTDSVSVYQIPCVGDLDGDGHVEIVVAKTHAYSGGAAPAYASNGVFVFDRRDSTSRLIPVPNFSTQARGTIGIAKPHDSSPGYIVIAALDGHLYAYDKAGARQWKSDSVYTTYHSATDYKSASIMFSDFNGDGYAEVVTGDRIFDLETGKMLLDCRFLFTRNILLPKVSVVDINKDGKPELVFGGNVYSIDITDRTGTSGNLYRRTLKVPDPNPLTSDNEITATIPADFDLDGSVDILAHANSYFYIYNPVTGTVKDTMTIPASYRPWGTPFVGDIDGDKYPEIMFGEGPSAGSVYHISAWDIDGGHAKRKWHKATTDISRSTGLTLFDFDQNGKFEILYRDETSLRIFNGESSAAMATPLDSIPCFSGTLGEYPVVADVDNDGEAEIVVTGAARASSNDRGSVYIFKSGPGTRWAPARKVWNQYAYNVVNINDDLSVPEEMFDIATRMAGPDSIAGTPDDVQPYNGFLKQSTVIDRFGNMVMYAPDAIFDRSQIAMAGDSVSISLCIVNRGDAALGRPVYVTLYRDSATPGNRITTDSIAGYILPGDTGCLTVGVRDIKPLLPFVQFVVRLNDDGRTYPVQAECDCSDSLRTHVNPALHLMMKVDAVLNGGTADRGIYSNPVSVLYSDTIEYRITAVNANASPGGTLVIRDTLPAYLDYATGTAMASRPSGFAPGAVDRTRDTLVWTFGSVPPLDTVTVRFKATPERGVNASQPMFVNRAWVTVSDTLHVPTGNRTYHQGAGVSTVTFSAAAGGEVYNATPQAIDFRTSPGDGVLVVPDRGYCFAGWSHGAYMSLRGEMVEARAGVMRYDTLIIYGNVELRADFVPEEYAVRYYLHGGENASGNPSSYTIESASVTLEAPCKTGDFFTGWTGSNGDEPQLSVVIPRGSTGERDYYANYRYSGREDVDNPAFPEDSIRSAGDEVYIRTSRPGSVVRIYAADGVLHEQRTLLSAGITRIRLEPGIYIVTINSGAGQKILIR